MQFEGHPHSWGHDSIQQVHVCKHPFIPWRRDAKVSLEKCMEAIEKWLQAVKQKNNYNSCILLAHIWVVTGAIHHSMRHGIITWWSYLADMLWEAVPRALLPRIHRPKQRLTSGESLSQVTGYNTTEKINYKTF